MGEISESRVEHLSLWSALDRTQAHLEGLRNVQLYVTRLAVYRGGALLTPGEAAPRPVRKLLGSFLLPHAWVLLQY